MNKYEAFAAAMKLKKKLAIAKEDLAHIKRILREIISTEPEGSDLKSMAQIKLEGMVIF